MKLVVTEGVHICIFGHCHFVIAVALGSGFTWIKTNQSTLMLHCALGIKKSSLNLI